MNGKLRNMAALYILCKDKILLLYRQGGKIVNNRKYNDKLYCGVANGNKVVFTEMPEYIFS